MKTEKQPTKKDKLYYVLTFPERLNHTFFILSIILSMVIGVTLYAVALPQRSYEYIPDYTEELFATNFNPYFRTSSSYTINSEKFNKKDTVVLVYKAFGTGVKVKNIYGSCLGISNDDTFYYMSPSSRITSETTSSSSYIKSSADISGRGFKELYAKVTYNLVTTIDSVTTTHPLSYITMKEDIIKLSKREINSSDIDEINSATDLFSNFKISSVNFNSNDTSTSFSVRVSFYFTTALVASNYHIDLQTWAIDEEGEVNELIGYYGVSNITDTTSYSQTITFPKERKITHYIGKIIYTNAKGEKQEFFYKQPFASSVE